MSSSTSSPSSSPTPPFMEFTLNWLDFSQHYFTFAAIFKFCDTAQSILFPPSNYSKELQALHTIWSKNCVMRSNRAKLLIEHDVYQKWKKIRVYPCLSKVGHTSWTCCFQIKGGDPSFQNETLALVETTMVATDETHKKAEPIEYRETLVQLMEQSKIQQQPITLGRSIFSTPEEDGQNTFNYSQVVRITDCDALNHVNNSVYATLAEESRLFAASKNKYDMHNNEMGKQPASECSISYIGQAHPFEEMEIVTWSTGSIGSSNKRRKLNSDSSDRNSIDTRTSDNSSNDESSRGKNDEQVYFRTNFLVNQKLVSQTTLTVSSKL
jgi:acyl-CoA thioesterase FadM